MTGPGWKVAEADRAVISIDKGLGRALALKMGEIVKARVVDVFADGAVSLGIKGTLLTAKTEVPLVKDSSVFFKVLTASGSETGQELRLQFKGLAGDTSTSVRPSSEAPAESETVKGLLDHLSNVLGNRDSSIGEVPRLVDALLKALPARPGSLPAELRLQLRELLETVPASSGQSIPGRIGELTKTLSTLVGSELLPEGPGKELLLNMGDLSPAALKEALENTGVILEAKLKSLAQEGFETAAGAGSDLKANLMRLRSLLLQEGERGQAQDMGSFGIAGEGTGGDRGDAIRYLGGTIDRLLGDIETFQLLSKATDSFYTFLPLIWKELREGSIAFKHGGARSGAKSYYCMMNLDFNTMGVLNIMVMLQGEEYFVSFKASDSGLRSLLDVHAWELAGLFQAKGLQLKSVNVLGQEDTSLAPFERLETLEGVLSIRI